MFRIVVDLTFDASRKEQVSFIIRFVDNFVGAVYERIVAVKELLVTRGQDSYELFKITMEEQAIN